MFGLKSCKVTFIEPVEVVYATLVVAVLVEVVSTGAVVDAVADVVEPVDVVVDDVPVEVESTAVVVDPDTALSVLESFFLFLVKPTLNPIVSATTAKPRTPSKTNRLRRVDFELYLATSCTKNG